MIHIQFIWKEFLQAKKQSAIFVFCVALSVTTLVSVNGLKDYVYDSILGDTRKLSGGDVKVHSHYPFSEKLQGSLLQIEGNGEAQLSSTLDFYSVVQDFSKEQSLLANINVVEGNYPLYGDVLLGSGHDLQDVLQPGTIVVAPSVLERLRIEVGDSIHVGKTVLEIADTVSHESSRPVNFFVLGPRILAHSDDLKAMDLVKTGSRTKYTTYLKLADQSAFVAIQNKLISAAGDGKEKVQTFEDSPSRIKRFFDNLFFFLSLISIFILLLAGIGMQSSLTAFLRQKEKSIAVIKSLGAGTVFVVVNYSLLVFFLTVLGLGLGTITAVILTNILPLFFSGLVEFDTYVGFPLKMLVQAFGFGFVIVALFTFFPMYRIKDVKPASIFRETTQNTRPGFVYYFMIVLGGLLLGALVTFQLNDVLIGLYFLLGCLVLVLLVYFFSFLVGRVVGKIKVNSLPLRQAFRSLYRPGNSTKTVMVTLSSALTVLLVMFLVQKNLESNFIDSFPEDAPTMFAIDIQPNQRQEITKIIPGETVLYPVIRSRLLAINGEPVNQKKELAKKRDNLAREFNLSYRKDLLANEVIQKGGSLFGERALASGRVPVSILDMVEDIGGIKFGDVLSFNIQGRPIEAEVVSVRSRTGSKLSPFFYFVFQSEVLQNAPQTFFAALRVNSEEAAQINKNIITAMPNVSVINMVQTAKQLGEIMAKLSLIISTFAMFSIVAGLLVLISSVLATRFERIKEIVYYKVLGANSRFVKNVFLLENAILGMVSGFIAVVLAQFASYGLCKYIFEITPAFYLSSCFVFLVGIVALVILVGHIASLSIIKHRPASYLQDSAF